MTMEKAIFRQQLLDNLTDCILPYWLQRMTDPEGDITDAATAMTASTPMPRGGPSSMPAYCGHSRPPHV